MRGAGRWARATVTAAGTALIAVLASACAAAVPSDPGAPLPSGRLRGVEFALDNDGLAIWPYSDRWYTAGARLRWVNEAGAGGLHARLAAAWCERTGCGDGARVHRVTALSQRIYTPADKQRTAAPTNDRPYGAALALGTGVLVREPAVQVRLDARIGVVGPAALGELTQNGTHRLLGVQQARGWDTQLRPRPLLQLGWSRMRRDALADAGLDWVHRFALDAGSVTGWASAGAMLRFGAPPAAPTWPAEPAAPWSAGDARPGAWHLFVGADARAVAYDRLVDGATFAERPSVRARPWVGDVFAGASVALAREWRLDLSMTLRSVAFEADVDPTDRWQRFGSLRLRWTAP